MSTVCLQMNHSSLGSSSLIFQKLESELCLDNHVGPNKGHKTIFNFIFNVTLQINRLTQIAKNLMSPNLSSEPGPIAETYSKICVRNKKGCKTICGVNLQMNRRLQGVKKFINIKALLSLSSYVDLESQNYKLYVLFLYRTTDTIKMFNLSLLILRSGDVEMNPGPNGLTMITQNCRGLKCKNKTKQLLCRLRDFRTEGTKIIALQETHIDSAHIKYSWEGNIAITPSTGSKGGVITLVSENVNIIEQKDIDDEAQILVTEVIESNSMQILIIINLHSPCSHDRLKLEFFEKIRNQVEIFRQDYSECEMVILGDFNTTFWPSERINTSRSKSEVVVATKIKDLFNDWNVRDCWNEFDSTMTWRHGDKMSRLDRIQWSNGLSINCSKIETKTDWTLTTSDHSAVIVNIMPENTVRKRNVITRIDTSFLANVALRVNFLKELDIKLAQLDETNLDPHGRLEFLKMIIRTIAIEIATNYRKEKAQELKEIQSGIAFWQSTLENSKNQAYNDIATDNLEGLMSRRNNYLNEKGRYLSERSKSKWYQEGERSTKYFLNLNKARNNRNEMLELLIDGVSVTDKNAINNHVESFYKKLYEKGDKSELKSNSDSINHLLLNLDTVSDNLINMVESDLTIDEIYNTLKSCSDSAPGPDGIPYSLIKLTWKFFGPILLESWKYAEKTGKLAPSHESSYLRLLPKEGKDIRHLKNWRPITLSNCDFKLITKTMSWRLTKAIDNVIGPNQTAYMKERQISDNLNVMLYTIEQQTRSESMIVSLDAEKAFDSLEHWYIKEVLKKVGLGCFIKTFEILYKKQDVSIILNGSNAGHYNIKNGVKQGDALSCILFILGIEPLLRNINSDTQIKGITLNNAYIPKAVAYADDIACLIKPDQASLQRIFKHYDDLTRQSGLKLNADKTEIISSSGPSEYEVSYNDEIVNIKVCNEIKINGLMLGYDIERARKLNIKKMMEAVSDQLKSWSNRNLSLLGKIQIFKTFGLSQILYTLTTVHISISEEKELNHIIYKFIWNKNMEVAKAPDRIKRRILLNKIQRLGFGMIDYREVVDSIQIRNLMRILNNKKGPLYNIMNENLNNSQINISIVNPIRTTIDKSVKLLRQKWHECVSNTAYAGNEVLYEAICSEYIGNLVLNRFKKQKCVREVRNDRLRDILKLNPIHPILKKIDSKFTNFIENFTDLPPRSPLRIEYNLFPYKQKILKWPNISSKHIRESRNCGEMIAPKMVTASCERQLNNLGKKISNLTNSKLKSVLLRCLHGDVYSKERMFRFGMVNDKYCQRCDKEETTTHMLLECEYVRAVWNDLSKLTGINPMSLNEILGVNDQHDKITLTIHAETLRRLLSIDRPSIQPKILIKSIISNLYILERGVTKYQIKKYLEML